MTDIFVTSTPVAYVNADDLPTVRDYMTEIVAAPSLLGWWSCITSQCSITSSLVTSVANRLSGGPSLDQATSVHQAAIASSTDLQREVLSFVDDGNYKLYTAPGLGWDSNADWTMVALCKPTDYVNRLVCGALGTSDVEGISLVQTGTPADAIRARQGDQNAQILPTSSAWQAIIAAGRPSAAPTVESNGVVVVGSTAPTVPGTGATFGLGNASLKFLGEVAEVGIFQGDLYAAGSEATLALVQDFINQVRVAGVLG